MDNDSGIFRYCTVGDIDKSKQTTSFKEGHDFNSFPASVGDKLDPVVYNYEIKDGISIFMQTVPHKGRTPAHFEFRFKKAPKNKRRNRKRSKDV